MVKQKRKTGHKGREQKAQGPYLAAALLCDEIFQDKDTNAFSAIRIVDQINALIDPAAPPDVPSENQQIPIQLRMFLAFKTGDAPGNHRLQLILRPPIGKPSALVENREIAFTKPPHGGCNLRLYLMFSAYLSGTYWIDIYLDDKRIGRMPFHVAILRHTPEAISALFGETAKMALKDSPDAMNFFQAALASMSQEQKAKESKATEKKKPRRSPS